MSDSDSDGDDYIPFSERDEWKDVTPIPQDDGKNPICPIMYKDEFKEKMNYFRAIIKSGEKSKRVIELIDEIIQDNPSNYTVWFYRREVLKAIDYSVEAEFDYVSEMGEADPKNYQIWNHRRYLVELHKDYSRELEFVADRLDHDAKNYHAWAHRQWVIKTFNLWSNELVFVDKLLKLDHRNNSAWNQRYFVLSHTNTFPLSETVLESELNYTVSFIKMSPNNESPWSYLRGLFEKQSLNNDKLLKILLEMKSKYIGCPHVLSLLLDVYQVQNTEQSVKESITLCNSLMTSVDQIHHNYWQYRLSLLKSK